MNTASKQAIFHLSVISSVSNTCIVICCTDVICIYFTRYGMCYFELVDDRTYLK